MARTGNYDRLADALLAVYPHWQTIATEVTRRAVEAFQLPVCHRQENRRHSFS
ncbi:MAG: hypothetical protein U9Q78_06760 [Chloroflexota bacterium]|nr:hypothetical protein [Chloroflexota bacterium]